jgi:hypothetical protein
MKSSHVRGFALPLVALIAAIAVAPALAAAKGKPKDKKAAAEAPPSADKPYQDWKKVTKDAEVKKGFFTLYQKRENLYLEIRADQLQRPFLGVWSLARGIGRDFVLGGLSIFNDRMLQFERSGDRILVVEEPPSAPAEARSKARACRTATRFWPRSRSRASRTRPSPSWWTSPHSS